MIDAPPTYEELVALVAALRAELSAVRAELAAARAEIVELRALVGRNSQNSSRPPSSDPPGTSGAPRPGGKGRSGRKRGGQPGHRARFSSVPERIDRVVSYRPSQCTHCRGRLSSSAETGEVAHHYVYELPAIVPQVTDHQRPAVRCAGCHRVSWAELPITVPRGQYGATVQAMVGLIRGELRQSVRQTSAVLTQLLHVPMSTGMVCKLQEQVSRALAEPHAQALQHVQSSARVHADETGWRQDKRRAWLWTAVCACAAAFVVHKKRSTEAAQALLGAGFAGILSSDRWSAYTWVKVQRRQLCWSHLKRDFASFLDYGPDAKSLGQRLATQRRALFRLWHRYRSAELSRADLALQCAPMRQQIVALLEEGAAFAGRKVRGMCRQILKLKEALFVFVDTDDVEPTNNAAEREIRFAVLMRKGCFGSDSTRGSRFIERFLTVRATLRMQRRDLYAFLADACSAAVARMPVPSLLPLS